MNIFSIVGIALISACLIVVLRRYSPEFSVPVSIIASIIILLISVVFGKEIFEKIEEISSCANISSENIKLIFKAIGICYIAQIGKDICIDCGERALGDKVDLAGKIAIASISIPVATQVLKLVLELINK